MFIGSNRVIACSESCIVRNGIYFIFQDSMILFQSFVATLFQYTNVQTVNAKYKIVRGNFTVTVCFTKQKFNLRTSELLFEETRLPLIMLFVFYTTCSREENGYRISSESINSVISWQPLQFHSHFRSDTIFQLFPGKRNIQQICAISNSLNLYTTQNLVEKL